VEVTNFHRVTMILDRGINSCSLYHYTVQGIFAIKISSSRALFTRSFDHVFELHCPWISFHHISKGQTNTNLIIIHFILVSKVEIGRIFICVATIQNQSVYIDLEGTWIVTMDLNPLNPELNPICYLLALLGAHHFLHVSRIRVKLLTFRRLISYIYIYGAPMLDVSRSHTTTQHSR